MKRNVSFHLQAVIHAMRSSSLGGLFLPLLYGILPGGSALAQTIGPVTAGQGQVVTIPDNTTVEGSTGSAITATGGGQVSGAGTHAIGAGVTAAAVTATGANSLISLTGPNTVIDAAKVGVRMQTGGVVKLGDNTVVNITGVESGSAGIWVQSATPADTFGSGIVINIDQSAPRTSTNTWTGVALDSGGTATFNNLTVQGNGVSGGVFVSGADTVLTLNGGDITVSGQVSRSGNTISWTTGFSVSGLNELGIAVRSGAIINLDGTHLTHTVSGSVAGFYADSAGATINANNVTITMSGNGNFNSSTPGGSSAGIYVLNNSVVNIKNSRMDILGDNFGGIRVGNNGLVNADNIAVTTHGTNDSVIRYNGSSNTINMTNSTLSAAGADNIGIISNNTTGVHVFNMSGGSMSSTIQAIYINNSNLSLNFSNGAQVTGGNGILLGATANNAHATVTADTGTILNGDMQTETLNSVTAILKNNAIWTGAARNIGSVSVSDGAIWNFTGDSDVQSLTLNNGAAISSPFDSAYKTLTVRGDYSGADGVVGLNTQLGDSGSPTDRLVVQGNTSGLSLLRITNTNGAGALTDGDGIRVVEVQGTSGGEFTLQTRVAAGLYEYTLHRGENDGNWYLSSLLSEGPSGGGPPNIRPEVPLASPIVPMAIEYGYAMLDTLHDRVGESRNLSGLNLSEDGERWLVNSWGRVLGNRLFHNAKGSFLDYGPSYDYSLGGVQAGIDIYANKTIGGPQNYVGTYLGYGRIDAGVNDIRSGDAGSVDMDAYSLGFYWTRYSQPEGLGLYSDLVFQGTVYNAQSASRLGDSFSNMGYGGLASLESGYAFDLGHKITLEPQAQIVYQYTTFDDATDPYGSFYFDDGSSLRGRLGLRLSKLFNTGTEQNPRRLSVWVRGNVWQEFMKGSSTTVVSPDGTNQADITSRFDGTWGEIEVGVSGQINKNWSVFATTGFQYSLNDNDRKGWDGRIGLRYEW